MEELKTSIHILAVADSQESASNLLSSCFPGVNSSDGQEWTKTEGSYTLKCYIKYPGTDLIRKSPSSFLDILVGSAASNTEGEAEVLNYIAGREDAAIKLWIDEAGTNGNVESRGVLVSTSNNVYNSLIEHIKKIVDFNENFASNSDGTEVTNIPELLKYCGYSEKIASKVASKAKKLTYANARKLYLGKKTSEVVALGNADVAPVFKYIDIVEATIQKFIGSIQTSETKENKFDCKIIPTDGESEGIGLGLKVLLGDFFKQEKPVLPLVIRDNVATLSIELPSKSPNALDSILNFVQSLYQMADGMGLVEKVQEFGASVSFRKSETSVFIDVTAGGAIGDFINSKINSLNLDIFKLGLSDGLKIQTNIVAKDLYEDFSVDKILEKASKLSIEGQGSLINTKTLLLFFKEIIGTISSQTKKQQAFAIYAVLRVLLCFESSGISVKFNSKDLKDNIISTIDNLNGEGFYNGFIAGIDEQFGKGMIPMALAQIEAMKGFASMLGDGPSHINFDKISVDLTVPALQLNLNVFLLLIGLTEFAETKVFN